MKYGLLTAASLALLALPGTGHALAVNYSLSSTQLCFGAIGCGVNSQVLGGSLRVSFEPLTATALNPAPNSFASLGQLVVSCVGGGTACGSVSLAGLNLYLNVSQLAPSLGNASFAAGALTGTASGTASTATVSWASGANVTIGTINYDLFADQVALLPPSSGLGAAGITALVSVVPEPAQAALLALGLAAMALRRWRQQKA